MHHSIHLRVAPTLVAGVLLFAIASATTAQAADVAAPATDLWTGFYLGAQAGYLQGTGSDTDVCESVSGLGAFCYGSDDGFDFGDNDMDGVTAGGYLGYNYRFDSFVMGLEGEINWDNAEGGNGSANMGDFGYSSSLNWDAAIRGRLGLVVDDRALLYVTGGPSWVNTELDGELCGTIGPSTATKCGDSSTEFGWVLGGGAEYFMTDHLSIKAEYLHGWYGDADLNIVTSNTGIDTTKYDLKQDLQTNLVRVGFAYHFGGL